MHNSQTFSPDIIIRAWQFIALQHISEEQGKFLKVLESPFKKDQNKKASSRDMSTYCFAKGRLYLVLPRNLGQMLEECIMHSVKHDRGNVMVW